MSRTSIPPVWQQWNMGAGYGQQDMGQLSRMCKISQQKPNQWKGEVGLISIYTLTDTVIVLSSTIIKLIAAVNASPE